MDPIAAWVEAARDPALPPQQRHDAFDQLVLRFQDMVIACTYDIAGDFHQAQDLAQETFLSAYLELDTLRQPAALAGWLRQIARRKALRAVEQQRTREGASGDQAAPPDAEAEWEQRTRDQTLHRAIAALPATQRTAIGLFYLGGYTLTQIAAYLEVPVDAVKKRLQRGRQGLRTRMEKMEETEKKPLDNATFGGQVRRMVEALDPLRAFEESEAGGEISPLVAAVRQWEERLDGADLGQRVVDLRQRLQERAERPVAERLAEVLPEALGLLAVHCRKKGQPLADEALEAAIVLHRGQVADSQEGIAPALFLNALAGVGAHLIALDRMGAEKWAEIVSNALEGLGLEIAYAGADQEQRQQAYAADITCVHGFDAAMDCMLYEAVPRPLGYGVIDRIETVLVQQVKVPLVLSRPLPGWDAAIFAEGIETARAIVQRQEEACARLTEQCQEALEQGDRLQAGCCLDALRRLQPETQIAGLQEAEMDGLVQGFIEAAVKGDGQRLDAEESGCLYEVSGCNTTLNERGYALLSGGLGADEEARYKRIRAINQGVRALVCYRLGREYIVDNNRVLIIDAAGQVQEGRRFSDGLHQALEAKEGVPVQPLKGEARRTTFQAFLRQYQRLAGVRAPGRKN